MILSDIKRYLEGRGPTTLAEMALHFRADPEALRGMLNLWVRKGKVEKHLASASCGGSCTQCDPAATEIYVWLGTASRRPAPGQTACHR